ncbi:MAG: addiction module antidote protein [Sphingopyxis solisilvae]|uniref:addiction module antidote protein n=1 Tax=Sphingopyxis solisilvae TaxID=1886788 RepID=UPI00403655EF
MGLKTTRFDAADYIETAEEVLFYLEAAMEGNDPKHIASALGDVARSKGMSEIARKTGLGRQALYNALSENGNPTLETLMAVLDALGLELSVQPKKAA